MPFWGFPTSMLFSLILWFHLCNGFGSDQQAPLNNFKQIGPQACIACVSASWVWASSNKDRTYQTCDGVHGLGPKSAKQNMTRCDAQYTCKLATVFGSFFIVTSTCDLNPAESYVRACNRPADPQEECHDCLNLGVRSTGWQAECQQGTIMIGVVGRRVTKSQRVCVRRGLGWMCGLVTGKSSRQGFESRYIILVLRKQLS